MRQVRRLSLAVLGAGDWAQTYHLPALRALREESTVSIAGIWNRTAERATRAAALFEIPRVYASIEEALEDPRVDCFAVLVHSTATKEVVLKLLPRGLPVFTEKPPGSTAEEARELAVTVSVANVVAFNRRYMPLNRRFRELASEIPDAYFLECHFYRNARPSHRFVMETGVHAINYMEHLCGDIVEARTERLWNPGTGTAGWMSTFTFASGVRGLLKLFPCSGSSIERYELHGTDRTIFLHCPQPYTVDVPGRIVVHEKGKVAQTIVDDAQNALSVAGFLDEYRDFFRSVREGTPTTSNFRNARATMEIAEAIEAAPEPESSRR